jgi:hypothetical protein
VIPLDPVSLEKRSSSGLRFRLAPRLVLAVRQAPACLGVVVVSLALSSPCFAQDPAAEALFRSAQDAANQGDWMTACDRFEESLRLEPAPGTVMNIARCREKLGQFASAWKSYNEALQRLERSDDRRAFAQKKVAELSSRVPHLVLSAQRDQAAELSVTVDGVQFEEATFGVPLPFDPGLHTIVVKREGHGNRMTKVRLSEGEQIEHVLSSGPSLKKEEAPDPAVHERSSSAWTTASFVVGGLGLATAGFGAVWMGVEAPKVHAGCTDGVCDPSGLDASSRGRTAVYLTAAGGAFAVLGIGIGSYLLLKSDERAAVAVAPLFRGAMLTLQGEL